AAARRAGPDRLLPLGVVHEDRLALREPAAAGPAAPRLRAGQRRTGVPLPAPRDHRGIAAHLDVPGVREPHRAPGAGDALDAPQAGRVVRPSAEPGLPHTVL